MRSLCVLGVLFLIGCNPAPAGPTQLQAPLPFATTTVQVNAIRVISPAWFHPEDASALAAATEEYVNNYGWWPSRSVTIRLSVDDQTKLEFFDHAPSNIVLNWPRAVDSKPVSIAFMPDFDRFLVYQQRLEAGLPLSDPLTANEDAEIYRGLSLPVKLHTYFPNEFD